MPISQLTLHQHSLGPARSAILVLRRSGISQISRSYMVSMCPSRRFQHCCIGAVHSLSSLTCRLSFVHLCRSRMLLASPLALSSMPASHTVSAMSQRPGLRGSTVLLWQCICTASDSCSMQVSYATAATLLLNVGLDA